MSSCTLCLKDLDRRVTACAFLVCELGHEVHVHQRCFDRAIDKAIRVRSTRSTSFENIARSATHNWKTQKCAQPECIKWLSEYTQEAATDPAAAADAEREAIKLSFAKSRAPVYQEEEEEEEEEPDRCTEHKLDGSRCNFMISDADLNMCRRCAEKHKKSEAVKGQLLLDNAQRDADASSACSGPGGSGAGDGAEDSLGKKKDSKGSSGDTPGKDKEKKSKSSKSSSAGLNSMLKNLAKPPSSSPKLSGVAGPENSPASGKRDRSNSIASKQQQAAPPVPPPGLFAPGASFAAMAGASSSASSSSALGNESAMPQQPKQSNKQEKQQQEHLQSSSLPTALTHDHPLVATDVQLVEAVRSFVAQHSNEQGLRTTPREIARFLGTLPGSSGGSAIEVMRARFHKLRNLLEAHPRLFALHDVTDAHSNGASPNSSGDGVGEYEVSLAPGGGGGSFGNGVGGMSVGKDSSAANDFGGEARAPVLSAGDILAAILPKIKPEKLPLASVDSILDQLGLGRFQAVFKENEFLAEDLFLVTDDDLKDIGLPVGPRTKLRNWVKSTVVAA